MHYSEAGPSADIHSQSCGNLTYYSSPGQFLPFFLGVVAPVALLSEQKTQALCAVFSCTVQHLCFKVLPEIIKHLHFGLKQIMSIFHYAQSAF